MSSITLNPHLHPIQIERPIALPADDVKNQLIQNIATSALKELVISFAMVGVTCLFVASTKAVAILVILAMTTTFLNMLLRTASAFFHYQAYLSSKEPHPEAPKESRAYQAISEFLRTLFPMPFALLDGTTRNVVVHEAGHALAAMSVYQNAAPQITVYPMEGGMTSYYPNELTKFGELLGQKKADLFVTAAGPGAAILFSTASLLVAKHQCEDKSEMQMYFTAIAVHTILQHVIYALSAFWAPFILSHDFISLWVHGIDPITAIVAMVALPVIALACSGSKKREAYEAVSDRDRLLLATQSF